MHGTHCPHVGVEPAGSVAGARLGPSRLPAPELHAPAAHRRVPDCRPFSVPLRRGKAKITRHGAKAPILLQSQLAGDLETRVICDGRDFTLVRQDDPDLIYMWRWHAHLVVFFRPPKNADFSRPTVVSDPGHRVDVRTLWQAASSPPHMGNEYFFWASSVRFSTYSHVVFHISSMFP